MEGERQTRNWVVEENIKILRGELSWLLYRLGYRNAAEINRIVAAMTEAYRKATATPKTVKFRLIDGFSEKPRVYNVEAEDVGNGLLLFKKMEPVDK